MNGEVVEKRLFDLVELFLREHLSIRGRLYYRELRPICSDPTKYEEDAIVAFLTGTSGDIQEGTCLVNVYVKDVQAAKSGMWYKNKARCSEIAEALELFPDFATKNDSDIYFKQSEMIATLEDAEIHQHFVSLKMKFKVLNEHY